MYFKDFFTRFKYIGKVTLWSAATAIIISVGKNIKMTSAQLIRMRNDAKNDSVSIPQL